MLAWMGAPVKHLQKQGLGLPMATNPSSFSNGASRPQKSPSYPPFSIVLSLPQRPLAVHSPPQSKFHPTKDRVKLSHLSSPLRVGDTS